MPDNSAFEKSLEDARAEIIRRTEKNMEMCCLIVEADAKRGCPVDMGQLRASITHGVENTQQEIVGRIGSNVEYAPYVHQGTGIYAVNGDGRKTPWGYMVKAGKYKGFHWTHGQKPQPFLNRAVMKNRTRIERRLGGGN